MLDGPLLVGVLNVTLFPNRGRYQMPSRDSADLGLTWACAAPLNALSLPGAVFGRDGGSGTEVPGSPVTWAGQLCLGVVLSKSVFSWVDRCGPR